MNEYCCIRVIARIKIVIKNPIFTSFKKSAQNVEIELNHKLFNSIWPVLYLNIISIFCNLISIYFPTFSRRNIPFPAEISLLKKIILENKRFKRIEVKVTFVGKKNMKVFYPNFKNLILYYIIINWDLHSTYLGKSFPRWKITRYLIALKWRRKSK